MKMIISAFAALALSALTCQAINVNQTYAKMTVASAIHDLYTFPDTNQFAQYVYDTGLLNKLSSDSVTVFYPVNSPSIPARMEPNRTLVDLISYHVSNDSIDPLHNTKRGITVSTYLISPNPETNMSDGTSQKFTAAFDATNLTINYGQSARPTSNLVYNCSNGYIYMLDMPLGFPLMPSDALADHKVTNVVFGSSNVSDYLNSLKDITFFTTPDAVYNTIDQVNNQVVSGIYYRSQLTNGESFQTLGNQSISISTNQDGGATANNVNIFRTIPVWNGVILVISNGNSTINVNNSTTTTVVSGNGTTISSASTLSVSAAFAAMAAMLVAAAQL